MSTPSILPIYQLNFDQVDSKLTDLTGNGYDATVATSGISVVNDPLMGRCLQFLGTSEGYVTIPNLPGTGVSDLSNGLTITAWVNAASIADDPCLLDFGDDTNNISLQVGSGTPYYHTSAQIEATEALTVGNWYHLAVTVDALGNAIFYVNGIEHGTKTDTGLSPKGALATTKNLIGIGYGGNTGSSVPPFKGMIAWMALYNGALGQSEVKADMVLGESNRIFVSSRTFPVDFKLYSNDGGAESPIMFIESKGTGQTLNLQVINSSAKALSIPTGSGTIGPDNYHFQLRFRPGILSDNYIAKHTTGGSGPDANVPEPILDSTDNPDWSAMLSKDASGNNKMSFLYTGDAALPIAAGAEALLKIIKVNASATGGSKNTNVEFKYQNIDYGATDTPIEGFRMQNISIVNHSGEKNIPLRAEIVGVASVMTYAKPAGGSTIANPPQSDLMFRLVNTGTKALDLGLPSSTDGVTSFTLSIDIQPDSEFMDWALFAQGDTNNLSLKLNVLGVVRSFDGTTIVLRSPLTDALTAGTVLQITGVTDQVTVGTDGATAGAYAIPVTTSATSMTAGADIKLSTDQGAWTLNPEAAVPTILNNQLQWTITNVSAVSFGVGEGMSFLLKGIECSLPAGSSTVTIQYKNVPGHWDGQFALQVQKSPVAYNENLMGINTQEPKANLHIIEENGNMPLRVQKMGAGETTLPNPDYTQDDQITNLVLIDAVSQTYYDTDIRFDNEGNAYANIWTTKGGALSVTPARIPHYTGFINSANSSSGWTNIYHEPYVFMVTSNSIDLFEYDLIMNELNYVDSVDSGHNLFSPMPTMDISDGFLFNISQDENQADTFEMNVFNLQNSPPTQISGYPKTGWSDLISIFQNYAGYLYRTYDTGAGITVSKISSDGSLGSGQIVLSNYSSFSAPLLFKNDFLYTMAFNQNSLQWEIVAVNLSDPGSYSHQSVVVSNNNEPASIALYGNTIFVAHRQKLDLYDLTIPDSPRLIKSFTINSSFICQSMGVAGDLLWISGPNSTGSQSTTQLFNAKTLLKTTFGQNTFISSEHIGVGTLGVAENASLNLPYPSVAEHSGLVIGDANKSESAALSILASADTAVDPVAINDASGNPIFNIKQPESGEQDYRVGIGTANPKAALHVEAQSVSNITAQFWAYNGTHSGAGQNVPAGQGNVSPISIRAHGTIRARQFYCMSDIRIKDILQGSGKGRDLVTLLNLQVSDYQYIDFVGHGTAQKKGLIAQQVKEVYPQAVSTESTDFIPDIYTMATQLNWDQESQELEVSVEKAHGLVVGDSVRLIAEKGMEEKEVIAVPHDYSFVVANWTKPTEKLFVFGKEVDDFHTVDYDQVAILGVSAIQALHAQMAELKKENEALKARMDTELSEIRQEWVTFKSSLNTQHQN